MSGLLVGSMGIVWPHQIQIYSSAESYSLAGFDRLRMEPNMVVMDIGSHCFKAGFAWNFPSDEEPRLMRAPCVEVLSDPTSASQAGGGVVRQVVDRGEIVDFDGLESIIHHSLYDALGWPLGGEGGNVVLSEAMLTSRAEREKLTQLMFEVRGCLS